MTTVTVVAEDRRVIVDGEVLEFAFPIDPEIWAIQWNGSKGHIEYRDNRMPEAISDERAVASWIALHAAEKERRRIELEATAATAERARLRDPAARKAELANLRWERQSAGIIVDGINLRTDRESILDLRAIAGRDAAVYPLSYKADSGWVSLASADMAGRLANAQDAHIQACFDREAVLAGMIDALATDPEALAVLDLSEGWP